eukprot:350742-Chlamydomonas_euryale.AAC.4
MSESSGSSGFSGSSGSEDVKAVDPPASKRIKGINDVATQVTIGGGGTRPPPTVAVASRSQGWAGKAADALPGTLWLADFIWIVRCWHDLFTCPEFCPGECDRSPRGGCTVHRSPFRAALLCIDFFHSPILSAPPVRARACVPSPPSPKPASRVGPRALPSSPPRITHPLLSPPILSPTPPLHTSARPCRLARACVPSPPSPTAASRAGARALPIPCRHLKAGVAHTGASRPDASLRARCGCPCSRWHAECGR